MTKEEAFNQYEEWRNLGFGHSTMPSSEVLVMAMDALRPVTREQVEKVWRGEWTTDGVCSRCGFDAMYYKGVPVQVRTNYCPTCGSPMTDKAVDMVMERLEALHSETKTD